MTGMPERKAPLSRAPGVPEGLGPDHPLRQTVRRYRRPDWVFGGASSAGKFTPMQMRKDQMNPTKTTFSSRLFPRLAILCLASLAIASLPGQALAHAHLRSSTPADKATVSPGPQILRLEFTESVEPKLSTVAVTMDDGMDMGPATLTTDPKNPKILIATLPDKLDPGTYNVVWHVVATDTHKTDGSYTFSVKP